MSTKAIEKKMRIQTYDLEFNMIEDRLVAQDTEMYKGPKDPHPGPVRVEFSLFDKEDVDACLVYLQKLKGSLPIEAKVKKPKLETETGSDRDREQIAKLVAEAETQDDAIRILRKEGFIFLTSQDIQDYGVCELGKDDLKYEWMIKMIREAKDPANNKYDPTLMFGFKIMGEKLPQYVTRIFGGRSAVDKPWKNDKEFNFKKVNLTKFHSAMVEEERLKFSKELAKLRKDPEAEPTKFFKRWAPYAEFLEKEEWSARLQ